MKYKICFLALLCLFFRAGAVNIAWDSGLRIGDKVPDLLITAITNNPKSAVRLSAFKGKLLIVDFWATNCGSCVAAIPRLDSLQQQFGDKVKILTVSYEKAAVVHSFMARNDIGKAMRLPVVTDDVKLAGLFPHRIISHEVWINEKGIVAAITDPEYVNAINITAFLNHETVNLPLKMDIMGFDYSKPLAGHADAAFYSLVVPYKPGVSPKIGYGTDTAGDRTRMYAINASILQLYLLALNKPVNLPQTMMQISVRDSSRVFIPKGVYTEAWNLSNSWCYESVLPGKPSKTQWKAALLADLNKFFHLNGRLESKMVKCLALERLPGVGELPLSEGGLPVNTLHSPGAVKILSGCRLSDLVWELNSQKTALPAIDDTGYDQLVDLKLEVRSLSDTTALNAALRPYGLVFKETTREMPMLIIEDAN